ncbi:hypothetical protein FBU30_007973 [Linnemannia zychae]|nr:hypothetical protein FBU30_007973 [Linnemannia zychae]
MDGAGFQGMPKFALTPTEEAQIPRPHSSASQVATAVPSTYVRRDVSSSPLRHHRPHYPRKPNEKSGSASNHPYLLHRLGGSNPSGLSVSFSSHSIHSQHQQQHQPPSPTSPAAPSTLGYSNDTDEHEYPQNPQDHHFHQPSILSPLPVRPSSQDPPPQRSFSLTPRAHRPVSPQNSDSNNNSATFHSSTSHVFLGRGSLDSYAHRGSNLQLSQDQQESWGSSVRVDSPEPLTDSDDSYHASKDTHTTASYKVRRSASHGLFGGLRSSTAALSNKAPTEGCSKISLESDRPNRNSQDSPQGSNSLPVKSKPSGPWDFSDEEKQEPRRSRSGWRPSLSLIRQESSSTNTNIIPQPKRYLQNDQRRVSDMNAAKARKYRKKRRKGTSRRLRRDDHLGMQGPGIRDKYALPDLFQVLEKKTRYPLSYDDFEAFLRRHRAVEYLNFWADVTAHEQLCKTFDVSERRFKRELQLEDRAFARERRWRTLDTALESGHFSSETGAGKNVHTGDGQLLDGQGPNSSMLYITSRSSLQLPLNDHLSFPQETSRYGLQDSASPFPPMPPSMAYRRGSEQRHLGAYNRLLAGAGGRRSSIEKSRYSLDESPISEHQGDSSASTPSMPRIRTRGSIDGYGGSRLAGRRPSASDDHIYNHHHRALERPTVLSPLNPSRPTLPDQNVKEEIGQSTQVAEDSNKLNSTLSQAVVEPASTQSLRIVEPVMGRKQSVVNFEGGHSLLLPPLSRRSGESAYAPSLYSNVSDGRALLAQSYRTITVEDLEESMQRIYRKYLIQLRTMSMAKEEEVAAASTSKEANNNKSHETNIRKSLEKSFAPSWDGYAEQVILEWNEKWKQRGSHDRRMRRISARRSTSGKEVKEPRSSSNGNSPIPPETTVLAMNKVDPSASLKKREDKLEHDSQDDDSQDLEKRSNSLKFNMKRQTTGTGITAFLSRLLKTETTVMELPTLTINTTTVEDYDYETDDSEYDEDDEYDSDDEQDDDDADDGNELTGKQQTAANKNSLQVSTKAPEPLFMKDKYQEPARPSAVTDDQYTNTVNGSLAGDRAASEASTHDSAIPLQSLFAHPSVDASRPSPALHVSIDTLSPSAPQSSQTPVQTRSGVTTSTVTSSSLPQPSATDAPTVATSAVAAAFYLPLECRQRIHTQVQKERRTDGPHLFGPAKSFVVDVVLSEHYYPLFLEYVKSQNLGLLHESHINNRIKRLGSISLGATLWAIVIATQITLVVMAWGGWESPWVWVVGVAGGYPASLLLVTGLFNVDDKHFVRFRKTIEPSIVKLHRRKAMWMMFNVVIWSSAVAVIFAALPQREQ